MYPHIQLYWNDGGMGKGQPHKYGDLVGIKKNCCYNFFLKLQKRWQSCWDRCTTPIRYSRWQSFHIATTTPHWDRIAYLSGVVVPLVVRCKLSCTHQRRAYYTIWKYLTLKRYILMFVLCLLLKTNCIQINIKANNTYKNQRQCGQ